MRGCSARASSGLIGAGRVGRVAAQRFRAFGATLIAYDPFLSDEDAVRSVSGACRWKNCSARPMSSRCTWRSRTRHAGCSARGSSSWIKDGAVFINSARSAILDTPALVAELRKNRFHAFLDVYDTEPLPLEIRSARCRTPSSPRTSRATPWHVLRCGRIAIERLQRVFRAATSRRVESRRSSGTDRPSCLLDPLTARYSSLALSQSSATAAVQDWSAEPSGSPVKGS